MEQFDIEEVNSPEELLTVKILLEEYWNSLGFNHQTFGFGDELDSLPGAFARPKGRLAMAILSGRAVACVAMRPLDVNSCEMKRLFVRPSARGHGVAQKLLDWLISEAIRRLFQDAGRHLAENGSGSPSLQTIWLYADRALFPDSNSRRYLSPTELALIANCPSHAPTLTAWLQGSSSTPRSVSRLSCKTSTS